jgi:hypothetical protein
MTNDKIDAQKIKQMADDMETIERWFDTGTFSGNMIHLRISDLAEYIRFGQPNTRPQAQSGDVIIPYNSEADRQLDIALRIGKRTDEGHVECFFKEEHLNQFKAALSQAQGVDLGKVITALIDAENGLKHMNVPENSPERRQCREALEEIRGKK